MNSATEERRAVSSIQSLVTVMVCGLDNQVLETREKCSIVPAEGDTIFHIREQGGEKVECKNTVMSRSFAYSTNPGVEPDVVYVYVDY